MDENIKDSQIEKKMSHETNKNKFQNLFMGSVKRKNANETKDSQDKSDVSLQSSKISSNLKANYLNSLLKKSFFNTINRTDSINNSLNNLKKNEFATDNNSKIYPKKIPKNFLPSYLFDKINININKKIARKKKNELT